MTMEGDAPQGQPAEGVVTLESLAERLGESEEAALDESEDSEPAEESEEVESPGGEEEGAESEDAEEGEESAEEPTFTIKVDGKEVSLKQSELIEQAQKGFDYTKKTMAVAEERKAAEAIRQEAEQLRLRQNEALVESVNRLEAYAKFMEAQIGQPPPISLAQQDAARYLAEKELYEARKGQLEKVHSEAQRLKEEEARRRQAFINQKAAETEKALKDTLPGWTDAMFDELAGYANTLGINPGNADMAMLEPGFWTLAHKAKAYDALMAEKAKLKPVSQLPKVHKPSGNNQPPQLAKRQEAMKRHRAKPSIETLADLL